MEQSEKTVHEIRLDKRNSLYVSGVVDVSGFDEALVVAQCLLGILNIEGSELHVTRLDVESGELVVEGQIDSMYYTEPKIKKQGLFGRR